MSGDRACPRDGERLRRETVGPAESFVCDRCGGVWISRSDLESFLQLPAESWKLPPANADRPIAVDNVAHCLCAARVVMGTMTRNGVSVGVCPTCGAVWFDGGDLNVLLKNVEAEKKAERDALVGAFLMALLSFGPPE